MENETYLGDGCYASFDGFAIWLRAPRENGDHLVALEPETLASLNQYAEQQRRIASTVVPFTS